MAEQQLYLEGADPEMPAAEWSPEAADPPQRAAKRSVFLGTAAATEGQQRSTLSTLEGSRAPRSASVGAGERGDGRGPEWGCGRGGDETAVGVRVGMGWELDRDGEGDEDGMGWNVDQDGTE